MPDFTHNSKETAMKEPSGSIQPATQFIELQEKAKKILDRLSSTPFNDDYLNNQQLVEELNVYHIELELQHEELQKTRDQLAVSEKYLNDLFSYAPVGDVVLNVDGKVKDVNKRAAEYFHLSPKIFRSQRLQSFIPHESLETFTGCISRLLDHNQPQYGEVLFRVQGSQQFWARIDMFQIENPHEPGFLILCSILDISKEKYFENELLLLNQHLEEKVSERTMELQEINIELAKEVAERREAEEEAKRYAENQKTLLREINHRVKNNMQIMVSLMKLQAKQTTGAVKNYKGGKIIEN